MYAVVNRDVRGQPVAIIRPELKPHVGPIYEVSGFDHQGSRATFVSTSLVASNATIVHLRIPYLNEEFVFGKPTGDVDEAPSLVRDLCTSLQGMLISWAIGSAKEIREGSIATAVGLERYFKSILNPGVPKFNEVAKRLNLRSEVDLKLPLTEWQLTESLRVYFGTRKNPMFWQLFVETFSPFTLDKPELTKESLGRFMFSINRQVNSRPEQTKKENKRGRNDQSRDQPLPLKRSKKDMSKVVCFRCGETGHKKFETSKCSKAKEESSKKDSTKNHVGACQISGIAKYLSVLLDSGASLHIFNDPKWFCTLKDTNASITTVSGVKKAPGKGTGMLPTLCRDGSIEWIQLENCLYIPSEFNLVSFGRLRREAGLLDVAWNWQPSNNSVSSLLVTLPSAKQICLKLFNKDFCDYFVVPSTTLKDRPEPSKNPSSLPKAIAHVVAPIMIRTRLEVQKWHLAANHAQAGTVVSLAKRNNHRFTKEALNMLQPEFLTCSTCRTRDKASFCRTSGVTQFQYGSVLLTLLGTRVHLSLGINNWNKPLVTPILGNNASTHHCIIQLLATIESKVRTSAVNHHINAFSKIPLLGRETLTLLDNLDDIPGIINTDEAYEFGRLGDVVYSKLGIRHETVPARHHNSLGVAENTIRTLKRGTKSALHHCGLPFMFWPYALHYASWHKNWMVTSSPHIANQLLADV